MLSQGVRQAVAARLQDAEALDMSEQLSADLILAWQAKLDKLAEEESMPHAVWNLHGIF